MAKADLFSASQQLHTANCKLKEAIERHDIDAMIQAAFEVKVAFGDIAAARALMRQHQAG